jgi:hypothetical protein
MQVTMKLFLHLTDMTILNSFLYKSCGGEIMNKIFPEIFFRELNIHSQEENVIASGSSRDRPSPHVSQHSRMEVKHSQRWPSKENQRRFRVF